MKRKVNYIGSTHRLNLECYYNLYHMLFTESELFEANKQSVEKWIKIII